MFGLLCVILENYMKRKHGEWENYKKKKHLND